MQAVVVLFLLLGAGLLLTVAFMFRRMVHREKQSRGIPSGLVVYSDLNVPAAPLFSHRLRLTGKPDYILRRGKQVLPVEVKTGRATHPRQAHVMQLAAYCLLLEDTMGVCVPEGVLVYNSVPYTIAFDPALRFTLESMMGSMRDVLRGGDVERNHKETARCTHCSMRRYCSVALD